MDTTKAAQAIADLLVALDVDEGAHTAETPQRVAKYWAETLTGYHEDPTVHLAKTFPVQGDPGLIYVSGIRVDSTCAHHMLPITGHATVAYRPTPTSRVVGLSKLARLVHGYARRLQIQEQLGHQVAHAIQTQLRPVGAACIITAEHGCMTQRGITQPETRTTTHHTTAHWDTTHPDVQAILTEHHRN